MKKNIPSPAVSWLTCIVSCGLFLGLTGQARAQEMITIQQAVEKTLNNNLQIKNSKLAEQLNDLELKQSKMALVPTLNASANAGISFGRSQDQNTFEIINQQLLTSSGSVSTQVPVFEGFSRLNRIRQNKLLLEAGRANTDKIKNDLILQVITSYMQILYNKDFLNAAQQQLAVAQQQLKQQQELLDVGNKTLADLAETKSLVATAELDVTTAENALTISYLTMAQLMDIPSATKYEVQAPAVGSFSPAANLDAEAIYAGALNFFPDIKLAGLNTAAAKKAVDVAKGSLYPRLSFGAGMGSSYSYIFGYDNPLNPQSTFNEQVRDRFSQNIGLSLSIPIFNGLQARAGVKRAKIYLSQYQNDEQLARNNLNKIIYQAVADLKAAQSTFESTSKTFTARKEAFIVIEQRYNVGLVNSLDYNTSQTNMNRAEIDMIRAKYDLLFKAKLIDYYLGKQITF